VPLVQLDLNESFKDRQAEISASVMNAMVDGFGAPETDLFQVFRYHPADQIVFSPTHGGVNRTELLWVQVLAPPKFDVVTKSKFFRAMAERFGAIGIPSENLLISLLEFGYEDVFAGKVRGN